MMYAIDMASGGMTHIQCFTMISSGIPVKLRILPHVFELVLLMRGIYEVHHRDVRSRDSAVGIETSYRLDDRGVGV
jgi:hypothetical protein